jgi:hypothetical protein
MELRPAENSGESEAQQHGVKKDEAADRRERVFAEDCQCDEPDGRSAEVQLLGGEISQWDTDSTECRVKETHEGVVQLRRVGLSRLELKRPIVSGKVSRQADKHFPQRWMDIEVEFALEVVRSEFAKAVPLSDIEYV